MDCMFPVGPETMAVGSWIHDLPETWEETLTGIVEKGCLKQKYKTYEYTKGEYVWKTRPAKYFGGYKRIIITTTTAMHGRAQQGKKFEKILESLGFKPVPQHIDIPNWNHNGETKITMWMLEFDRPFVSRSGEKR